ncbi:2240_t:CDS:2 [Acaulospora morrowiae]|uniref:2240_t:CDS:1 n=1 Tax=Acaulospora morrowiae TaxID=94023 RepID=A0A9N8VHF7_9GLOM|nr:2240_t:CDS:2 [Acaulospora morrowiae]
MSDYKIASKGKLSFKGDKSSRKKKKRKAEESLEEEANREGWVRVATEDDLIGPLFFIFNSEPLSCLYCSEKDNTIGVRSLPPNQQLIGGEPEEVSSVFVGAKVAGSESRITLKTFSGKYLASDKFGIITADREAIGPQEEWTLVIRNDGVALQSYYDKFLSVDEIADGGFRLRADAESIGFCETWIVKCQARFRKKAKSDKKEVRKIDELEIEQIKKYQTWGGGRIKTTKEDVTELRKAKKEGKMAEALLDRREKVKADRYCK